jgi:hypothetical protein
MNQPSGDRALEALLFLMGGSTSQPSSRRNAVKPLLIAVGVCCWSKETI